MESNNNVNNNEDNNDDNKSESDILIYILYHNQESYIMATKFLKFKWAKLRKIYSTKYFESIVFLYLDKNRDEWINKKFVGFLTYNSYTKMMLFDIEYLVNKYSDYDLIAFNNNYNKPLLIQAETVHPSFINIWEQILLLLNYDINDILSLKMPLFYNNYWMAKPSWLSKYIEFYKNILYIMENNKNIKYLLYKNSKYTGKLLEYPEILIKICGRPYYTFHPFIIERLPCFFFWAHKAKIHQAKYNTDKFLNF
jgi:hypothetical protein